MVAREVPLRPVFIGRETVLGRQVTLQRLELLSVLQAHDVVRMDRPLGIDCRSGLFRRLCGARFAEARQRRVNIYDQAGKVTSLNRIVADIGRTSVGCQFDKRGVGEGFVSIMHWLYLNKH